MNTFTIYIFIPSFSKGSRLYSLIHFYSLFCQKHDLALDVIERCVPMPRTMCHFNPSEAWCLLSSQMLFCYITNDTKAHTCGTGLLSSESNSHSIQRFHRSCDTKHRRWCQQIDSTPFRQVM